MNQDVYSYYFSPSVPMVEVEASLVLAIFAVESLHGAAQVKLDTAHFLDTDRRACAIDGTSVVGRDLNRIFAGFLSREFSGDAFRIRRHGEPNMAESAAA